MKTGDLVMWEDLLDSSFHPVVIIKLVEEAYCAVNALVLYNGICWWVDARNLYDLDSGRDCREL